jgi:hypothetical protein
LWGLFCQSKWGFIQIIGRAVNEKAKWLREKRIGQAQKIKFLPENSILNQINYASSTFTDSRGVPCYK